MIRRELSVIPKTNDPSGSRLVSGRRAALDGPSCEPTRVGQIYHVEISSARVPGRFFLLERAGGRRLTRTERDYRLSERETVGVA